MGSVAWRRLAWVPVVTAVVPGTVAAAGLDPATLADAPPPIRAVGAFVLVSLFGGGALFAFGGFLDGAIDASTDRPLHALVYGATFHAVVGLGGTYAYTQFARLVAGATLPMTVVLAAAAVAWLVVAGVGFTVAGTVLTEFAGRRQPDLGVVVGAGTGAVLWFALPTWPALLASVLVVSYGIGGATKRWVHATQGPEVGTEPDA
jgi:hypothetical protein